jgi:hypothetical protein
MFNQIFLKRKSSKLSCHKLAVISSTADTVEVTRYNFRDKKWGEAIYNMKTDQFVKNYTQDESLSYLAD